MTPLQWLQKHSYARIDYPGGVGGECVDACNSFLTEVWRLLPVRANARDWAGIEHPGLVWESNAPENAPPIGAVVVWRGPSPAEGIGGLGHVAVVLAADARVLLTADQNWSGRKYVTVNLHDYDGVAGWLRPSRLAQASAGVALRPDGKLPGKVRAGAS